MALSFWCRSGPGDLAVGFRPAVAIELPHLADFANLGEVELYQQAQADLDNKSYTSAISKLKALESRYPFGRFAEQAQLELIYAYYRNVEPEAARSAARRNSTLSMR